MNAPFSWPKSSLSRRVSASAAQCSLTNGAFARGLFSWMACATSSLPVPLSPVMRTLARLGATCSMTSNTCCIAGLLPTMCVEPEVVLEARAELGRLVLERPPVERTADDEHELVDLERLGQVVLGPLVHRADGGLDLGERRHEHHDELGVVLARALQELDPVHAGHPQVGHQDVRRRLLDARETRGAVLGQDDVEALVAQERGQAAPRARFVVRHDNAWLRLRARRSIAHGAPSCRICVTARIMPAQHPDVVRIGRHSFTWSGARARTGPQSGAGL